jgi:predicted ester cyclase
MKPLHALLLLPLAGAALSACQAPKDPAMDQMMADHKAMLAADSTMKATKAAYLDGIQKVYAMFASGNADSIGNFVATDFIDHETRPGVASTGLQGLKEMIARNHAAFPDLQMTVLSSAVDGNMVMVHFNFKGTNTGPLDNGATTNKPVDVNGVDVLRFENGKCVEHWGYMEESKMMEQLGLMPSMDGGKKK